MKNDTPPSNKVIREHTNDIVHLAKTVGKYLNSEANSTERTVLWQQLNYEYEDFCEWRHEEPFRLSPLFDIIFERGRIQGFEWVKNYWNNLKSEGLTDKQFIIKFNKFLN